MTHNFNAGPAVMPQPVLAQIQAELLDYRGTGMSIMEISHRSKEFEAINQSAEHRIKTLLGAGDNYRALFVQGGASLQFAMIPLNFLPAGAYADYIVTGAWGEKALEEAQQIGDARLAGTSAAGGYRNVPHTLALSPGAAYVHLTTNETIQGVQFHALPDVGDVPLIADMSSDFLSRPTEIGRYALAYGGAQKNMGPSGVTVVLIRDDLLARASKSAPTMLRYTTHAKTNSLYNTPPAFGIYALDLVLAWIADQGGLAGMGARNTAKAATIYTAIDSSGGFYTGHAAADARSQMNVTFRLPDAALEKIFVAEALAVGMVGLAGHRSVGGVRASIYNALEPASCDLLAHFMGEFVRRHG